MSDASAAIQEAIAGRNAAQLRSLISAGEFVLLNTIQSDEQGEETAGAITADIDDMEVLVAFSSEEAAGEFVRTSGDLFEDDEEVEGIVVEGNALIDYLPEGLGIMLDPEEDSAHVIDPSLIAEIKASDA